MRVVFDIEANGLEEPTKIWVVVCKDLDTGEYHTFRRVTDDTAERQRLREFLRECTLLVGHNSLGYDVPCLVSLVGCDVESLVAISIDTLIVSKLVNYSRKGHSIEDYGLEFGLPKGAWTDFSQYSEEMEKYCARDVDVCELIYRHYLSDVSSPGFKTALEAEQRFQIVVNTLPLPRFAFNVLDAEKLLARVNRELSKLDEAIHVSFPKRSKLVREVHPVYTKHGTLHRKDFRFVTDGDLSTFNGGPFSRFEWTDFNPASHRQVIDVLHSAGWKPVERTATAIKNARNNNGFTHRNGISDQIGVDIEDKVGYSKDNEGTHHNCDARYGWKINEINLATLPAKAPASARTLARRILVESRRRTLTEWLALVSSDRRIHGKFYSIGAWTHRMAHQRPNTANIPNTHDLQGGTRLYGAEMRSLWCAPPGRYLVGVDAEGIQLRIFAHYINDAEFTYALVNGKKENKTDPHSLNQRILGSVCRSRASAKRFIYALLLGAGSKKLAQILDTNENETKKALDRLLLRYTGWASLKETVIPRDAKAGYFVGLDGRRVRILGDTENQRRHLAMSGYLQNGEVVVMKHATLRWHKVLCERGIEFKLVNFVHDEWQTECEENLNTALAIAYEQADSLRWVGEQFKLNCPLAGSYWNDDLKDYTIGKNWKVTH